MQSTTSRFLRMTGACAAGAGALAYAAYRKELALANDRIETGRQFIETPRGSIEFAEAGDGPAVLVIHGAGGGFDQGLDLGRGFLGDAYRLVAPSRFGYLGTPVPDDASPQAQADAHLRLLDALQLETVPVIGVSAGGPSALQLCLRHPERCSALVLVVPMAWAPDRVPDKRISPMFRTVLTALTSSDFLYWTATKFARTTLAKTLLGIPEEIYRTATAEERRELDRILRGILPISKRVAGIFNDSEVSSNLTRFKLEDMHVPTLVISTADDLYNTYEGGLYTAEQIHDGKFVGFSTGGHLLLGHQDEARAEITRFLEERLGTRVSIALAL